MKKIIHFLNINTPASEVYSALTTTEGLSGWWTEQVQVQSGVGGLIDFRFAGDFNPDMEVTRLQEDQFVAWKCVGGHDNWQDNTFSFELRVSDSSTEVMFIQVYAQELSDEVYGTYNFNWGYYMSSLKQLCETGVGTPYTPA